MILDSLHPVVSFQKKMYLEYLKRVNRITGKSKSSLSKYEKEFRLTLPEDHYPTSKNNFLRALEESNLILFGDFHTLINSQKILMESIRAYRAQDSKSQIIIALEAFDGRDRKFLDQYLNEEMSESEFLKKTKYYKKWCFPWFHYKEIFNVAKEIGATVVPVNSSLKKTRERDRAIARNLLNELKNSPEAKVFCLIGEFHLAENHLFLNLFYEKKKTFPVQVTRVLSNVDEYYFNHKFRRVPGSEKYLSLDLDFFCLINTPPWIKWFTYAQWEDDIESGDFEIRAREGLTTYDYVWFDSFEDDVEYLIGDLTRRLASFFKVSVDLKDFYQLRLRVLNKEEALLGFEHCPIETQFLKTSFFMCRHGLCSDKKVLFYQSLTLGAIVSSVGGILFSLKSSRKKLVDPVEIFSKAFIRGAFSALCELIFNPYSHTQESCAEASSGPEFFLEMKRVLEFLKRDLTSSSEADVILFMEELSKKDPCYWGRFFRFCAHRMFERLFHDSSFFLRYIQKDFLKRKAQKSFKNTLITYLEVALTP